MHRSILNSQVRGPLTALRTLGSILVPRLRQAQGREVDRDVVQGMLTQAGLHCQSIHGAALYVLVTNGTFLYAG